MIPVYDDSEWFLLGVFVFMVFAISPKNTLAMLADLWSTITKRR